MYFADSVKAVLWNPFFLLEIWTTLVTLMFLSPELKDPIILDPGKKVVQYQSIQFSHGLK